MKMHVVLSAMIWLWVSTTSSASASRGLYSNATAAKTPLEISPDNTSSDFTSACPATIFLVTTVLPSFSTITIYETKTVTVNSAESPLAARAATELPSPRGKIRCLNRIQSSTEAEQSEPLPTQDPLLKPRDTFNTNRGELTCATTITEVRVVTLPAVGTFATTITTTIIELVRNPPDVVKPTNGWENTSEDFLATPPPPPSETGLSAPIESFVSGNPSELSPASIDLLPSVDPSQTPAANRPDPDTPGPTTASEPYSAAEPVAPLGQTPPVNSILFTTSASPGPSASASEGSPSLTLPVEAVPEGQIQPPDVLQSRPPVESLAQTVLSTEIPVQQATAPVVPVVPSAAPESAAITFGTDTFAFVASSSFYVISGQTLAPGGAAITVSGSVVSLATTRGPQLEVAPASIPNDGQSPISTTTVQLSSSSNQTPTPSPIVAPAPNPVIATIGTSPITLSPSASSLVFTPPTGPPITLLPGSPAITLPDGTVVSLAPANPANPANPALPPIGSVLISAPTTPSAQTITFPDPLFPHPFYPSFTTNNPSVPFTTPPAYLPVVISSPPFLIIGSSTLTPNGPAETISGVYVSFGTNSGTGTGVDTTILVVGTSTITIAPTATGIGGFLYSGLNLGDNDAVESATLSAYSNLDSSLGTGTVLSTLTTELSTGSNSTSRPSSGGGGIPQQPTSTSTVELQLSSNAAVGRCRPLLWMRASVWEQNRVASAVLGLVPVWGSFFVFFVLPL